MPHAVVGVVVAAAVAAAVADTAVAVADNMPYAIMRTAIQSTQRI